MFSIQQNLPFSSVPFQAFLLNPFPNDKSSDVTKLKAFAEDKIEVVKVKISVFDRVENTVGKRRKCWLPAFSPFPYSVFQSLLL